MLPSQDTALPNGSPARPEDPPATAPRPPSRPGERALSLVDDSMTDLFHQFAGEVARRHLSTWLPVQPSVVLDLSLRCRRLVTVMVEAGHTVVHAGPDAAALAGVVTGPGRLVAVHADPRSLDWLADGSVDVVVAEGGALSAAVATEMTLDDVHRVLRPGGRLLIGVDSLVAGLARLADQGRWAELADLPAADVVLVPGVDGTVSRCFWPEELAAMLAGAGFDVEWVRPRTVLAVEAVNRALSRDHGRLETLVDTELALEIQRQGESIGAELVASARRL